MDYGVDLVPIEIKSGATVNQRFFDNLSFWYTLTGTEQSQGYVVYAGTEKHMRSFGTVVSWSDVGSMVR